MAPIILKEMTAFWFVWIFVVGSGLIIYTGVGIARMILTRWREK